MSKQTLNNMPRMMEQERAKFALERITEFTAQSSERHKELRSHVSALPALIRMNGLGQALAFYRMKDKGSSHEQLYLLRTDKRFIALNIDCCIELRTLFSNFSNSFGNGTIKR